MEAAGACRQRRFWPDRAGRSGRAMTRRSGQTPPLLRCCTNPGIPWEGSLSLWNPRESGSALHHAAGCLHREMSHAGARWPMALNRVLCPPSLSPRPFAHAARGFSGIGSLQGSPSERWSGPGFSGQYRAWCSPKFSPWQARSGALVVDKVRNRIANRSEAMRLDARGR